MNDHEFLAAFERGDLHPFHHRDHIHVAWLYLRRDGWEAGTARIRTGIQHFAQVHQATTLYHETITLFWAHLVYFAIQQAPEIADFEVFAERYAHLLDKSLVGRHYSPALLASQEARRSWMQPDLIPLPQVS